MKTTPTATPISPPTPKKTTNNTSTTPVAPTAPMPKTSQSIKQIKPTKPKNSHQPVPRKLSANLVPLSANQLKRISDPKQLPKDSNLCEAVPLDFGQQRAVQALTTALDIKANGYHVFGAGENGLGKRTLVNRLLKQHASNRPTPNDWVYVHNFVDARQPIALTLPAGMGQRLADDMKQFWLTTKKLLNQRFRSEHYQSKVEAIKNEISQREEQAFNALHEEGKQYSLALTLRPSDNKPIFVESKFEDLENLADATLEPVSANDSQALLHSLRPLAVTAKKQATASSQQSQASSHTPHPQSKVIGDTESHDVHEGHSHALSDSTSAVANYQNKNHMQKRLSLVTIALEKIEDEANHTLQALHQSLTKRTLKPLISPLYETYADLPEVMTYLQQVHDDVVKHIERIINEDDEEFLPSHFSPVPARYFVNVMATHQPNTGLPIVFEDLPTHLNLLGHVEQITHLGTISTDVSLIRAGSLHRANGGFLILEANSLLEYPYAWQGLKRALQSRQIKMSSLEQMLTLTGSISLEPQAIGLDVKVILLGEPDLYYDLLDFEPEFNAVFKIRADFHDRVDRTLDNEIAMVNKIADMVNKYELLTFDNTAFASLLDYLSEQAEDQNELSLHSDRLAQVLLEANRHALLQPTAVVTDQHVKHAIKDIQYRSGYLRQLFWQELEKGQQLISTTGEAVGQVNALTVISYADSEFGMPARLTASVHASNGHADIIDIERDVDLGGSIHAKGVLIMSSYLRALFAEENELNFTASLAFEQSYGGIDGDSATIAETCALLSALAQVPIKQSLAVTGSMNQFGQVQAVGGINAKIAGFYDACVEQGLTGKDQQNVQGVIMPKANLTQLMLRQDIVESVKKGEFTIYAVEHVNEALALLTGVAIDDTTKKGRYKKATLYGQIERRLEVWAEKHHEEKE
ncbi:MULTISPECIES: AAA family ATPase [unclassified Moraxella]|uniref:AAA family ATPase n=1 Tax=unclassified Moraxella TaxID=2685852 RepID=UPI003AF5E606